VVDVGDQVRGGLHADRRPDQAGDSAENTSAISAKNVTVQSVNILVRYRLEGRTAKEISASVEAGVRGGQLAPGDQLPAVRELAAQLGVSPTTVAAAYGDLRRRGLTAGAGRAGTRIRGAPPVSSRVYLSAPAGTRDLITGGPDPDLLPLLPAWPARRPARMYAEAPVAPRLRRLTAGQLAADGIDTTSLTVTGGALDAIERVLATWLTPADRVIVEDPGHAVTYDLIAAMGFTTVPVPVDDLGIRPDELAAALARGAGAVIVTPRAQSATGAAWDAGRAAEIAGVLRRYPSAGVIEDDHAGPVAGVPGFTSCAGLARWVTLRSVSKSLGPDLRLAVVAGDEATITRVAGRQALGTGWVSYQLQEMVADLWSDATAARTLAEAARVYAGRGGALRSALAAHGITASGRSGFTCWVSVADEDGVAAALAQGGALPASSVPGGDALVSPRAGVAAAGWAVAPGRRFRIAAPPGVRISFARLAEPDAPTFAAEFAQALRHRASRLD
jgi:DNA-binding transcriptional MocR family regulator